MAQPPAKVPAKPAPDAREIDPKRHAIAGGGKELPDQGESAAGTDEEKTEADAAFAWFGVALPPPPEAAPPIGGFGQPAAGDTTVEGDAAPVTVEAMLAGLTEGAAALPGETNAPATETPAAFQLPEGEVAKAPVEQVKGLDLTRLGRAELPARVEIAGKIELPANSPVLQTIAALQPRGETQPMAVLAASAGIELPEQFRRPAAREATTITALAPQTGATEILRPHVVQAVADAQQASIDTRRAEWMSQTIDRIEALRDSPNSRETSIRLSPDALGKVDVSIRHEGDKIHVRFSAETAQARTLLTEAQSRLTEIAEARGVKLGQTSVDAGTAGQGQRQDAAPRIATPSAPASPLTGSETTPNTDTRVA